MELLKALKETEHSYLCKKGVPFLSPTTLKAMRVTTLSTLRLTAELLHKSKFKFVLTGKFNQDCVEVGY